MKKFVLLICSFVVIFSCVTTAYAWPVSLSPEALAQLGLNEKFNGESIAVLVCDPFDAYLNGNECREVSYSALSGLRDRLVMQSFDVRLQKGFNSDYYYLAFYDRFNGAFKGSYTIDVSYTDGDEVKTSSYTVEVDGYNDYAVDFNYTPGGFVVSLSSSTNHSSASSYRITIDAISLNNSDLSANLDVHFGSLIDKLDIMIGESSESLENRINVTIDASNDAHNVFYITGEDGEEQSVTEFSGDLTKASGRLLSLLYRLVFADALSTVDGDLDGFEDFFTSQGDDIATQSMESPSEEENVWLAS